MPRRGVSWLAFGGEVIGFGDVPVSPPTDTFLRFGIASGLIVAGVVGLEQSGTRIGSPLMQRAGDAVIRYICHTISLSRRSSPLPIG